MSRTYRKTTRRSAVAEANLAKLRQLRDEFAERAGIEAKHKAQRRAEQQEFSFAVAMLSSGTVRLR